MLGQKEEAQSEELVEVENSIVQKPVFVGNKRSLHYTIATGDYTSDPRPKPIKHTTVDDIEVHFWKTGLHNAAML